MFLLAILWLYLFFYELISGLNETQQDLIFVIWILFVFEYLIKLILAPRRWQFIKENWITEIALVIPAFRMFRIFYAIRILQSVRVINSANIIRALTSSKRFLSALKQAQGPRPETEMHLGIIIAAGNHQKLEGLTAYAEQLMADTKKELEKSSGIKWNLDLTEPALLEDDNGRRPSDFLDMASLSIAEGPYDLVTVITDVPLMSRSNQLEPGLVSTVTRIMVISTRKLTTTGRNLPPLELTNPKVRFNSALLFLHLTGHILGLKHSGRGSRIMAANNFQQPLEKTPSFTPEESEKIRAKVDKAPDRELKNGNYLETFIFHLLMAFRHPRDFFRPLLKSWAVFLPLSLPGLATAAVAPGLLLVFTAEIWDVGFGMTNATSRIFAVISILCASFYLVRVQSLFLPRKEKRLVTEHLAVANSVIYTSILLACIGLFLMMVALMLIIEIYIFPEGLMQTWPTLETGTIDLIDKIRLAVFISTICVTTGALAGGLESRTVIHHLALFRKTS